MNAIQAMFAIQKATLEARARTGDNTIGTHAENGKVQIIRVTYDAKGKSTITPLSGWMNPDDVPAALAEIK